MGDKITKKRISNEILSQPVVALGRGGSGTRLLSLVLQEHGLFLGNQLNETEDSIEWVDLIYEMAIHKLNDKLPLDKHWHQKLTVRAKNILCKGHWMETQQWGWKLPETMLIVSDVVQAFCNARILHLVRHPVDTCLRRTHMTSRMNTSIGAATLVAAYSWLNWNKNPQNDEDYLRNTASWIFQIDQVVHFCRGLSSGKYLEIKYEDLCTNPQLVSDVIAAFLGKPLIITDLEHRIDHMRRRPWAENDERAHEIWAICEKTGTTLGYQFLD